MSRINRWVGMFLPPPGQHRTLRLLLFVLLIMAMIWAYNLHFERKLDEINNSREIVDRGKILRSDDRKALKKLVRAYRQEYGIRLRLEVRNQNAPLPELTPQTLLAAVGPEAGQVLIVLPHLVRKALPEESEALYAERLAACTRVAPPGACLERFLLALQGDLQQ